MNFYKKLLSTILCFIIVLSAFSLAPISALTYPAMAEISSSSGSANIYSLPGTYGHETEGNKYQSQKIDTLNNGVQVKVLGIEKDGDGDPWYEINYGDNFSKSGYAYASRVLVKYMHDYDDDFEKNLQNFPESYHMFLRELHIKYPNWKFVANNLDLSFDEAVESQYGVHDVTNTRKWVEFSYGGNHWRDMRAYDADPDTWITLEDRWTYASRDAIEYFMDPRNSLNEDMIFAFMQQSYQEDENMQANIRTVIKGTFLENGYDTNGDGIVEKDAYIDDIITAAASSGVSPYVLAATIIVEQGVNGQSELISGTYTGYEGYYNFFNFGAYGTDTQSIIQSGLTFAKSNGWNSRRAAIIGGAKKYAEGYISVGQDTYYYKDFNVIKQDWNHQYASALYDAWTNAKYLKKAFDINTDSLLVFSIPVYKDMPTIVCPNPTYMVDSEVKTDCIDIVVRKTGVYALKNNNYSIVVLDKNNATVEYLDENQGWPLVAGQMYRVVFEGYKGDYKNVVLNIQKVSDIIFTDTDATAWYNDAVTYAVGAGIITGYGGTNNFGAADKISRHDFVVILARFAGVDLSAYDDAEIPFKDVADNQYYTNAILWAAESGITSGYTSGVNAGKFGVGDEVTREQLVTFLYRYAKNINGSTPEVSDDAAEKAAAYPDFAAVGSYATEAVIWALDKGVISGQGGTHIAPGGNALRCEVAKIFYNIYLNDTFK